MASTNTNSAKSGRRRWVRRDRVSKHVQNGNNVNDEQENVKQATSSISTMSSLSSPSPVPPIASLNINSSHGHRWKHDHSIIQHQDDDDDKKDDGSSIYDSYIGYDLFLNDKSANGVTVPTNNGNAVVMKQQEADIYSAACGTELICSFHVDFIPKAIDLENYFKPFGKMMSQIYFEKVVFNKMAPPLTKTPSKGIPIARIRFNSYSALLKIEQKSKDGFTHTLANNISFRAYSSFVSFTNAIHRGKHNCKPKMNRPRRFYNRNQAPLQMPTATQQQQQQQLQQEQQRPLHRSMIRMIKVHR